MAGDVVVVRHGETEWSRAGRHTGRTDVPLTPRGEEQARGLRAALGGHPFAAVLSSPLQRAARTAALAGLSGVVSDPRLVEWDYGDAEGRTSAEIRAERPGWYLWDDGVTGGETAADVGRRADAVLADVRPHLAAGDVALVAHGHLLRVLTARWLGLPATDGRFFVLEAAGVGVLSTEHDRPVVSRWNAPA